MDETVLASLTTPPPKDATGMDVVAVVGWDYQAIKEMERYSRGGWLIIPGSFQVVSLPNSKYGGSNAPRPYIAVQMWRKEREVAQ